MKIISRARTGHSQTEFPVGAEPRRPGSVRKLALAGYGAALTGFLTGPIQARVLGPSQRGELAAIGIYAFVAYIALGLGLPIAVKRELARDPSYGERVFVSASRAARWSILPAAVLGAATVFGPLAHISATGRTGAFFLILLAPLAVQRNHYQGAVTGEDRLGALASMRLFPALITTVAMVALYLMGILNLIWILVLTQALIVMQLVILMLSRPAPRGPSAPMRPMMRFGLRSLAGQLAETSNLRMDQALLVLVVPAYALGQYAVAVTVALLPVLLAQALSAKAFTQVASSPPDLVASRIEHWLKQTTWAVGLLCILIAVSVPIGIPLLYGPNYLPSVGLVLLLLPGTLFFALGYMAGIALVAVGRPGASSIGQLFGTAVTAIGIIPAAHIAGVAGAAVLSDAAYAMALAMLYRRLRPYGVRRIVPTLVETRASVTTGMRGLRRGLRQTAIVKPLFQPTRLGS